jgi:hypothetical protein
LAAYWPELSARLGSRLQDFINAGRQKAGLYQLQMDAAVARYVNLCFALGPNFEDKAENEWALALLSNDMLTDWVKVHQLVVRATAELRRIQADGGRAALQLQHADAAFLDASDALPWPDEIPPLGRVACDVDVMDISLLEHEWRREYTCANGVWTLTPVAPIATVLRLSAGEPIPGQITVLSHTVRGSTKARVQVRQRMHACCDQDRHPALSLAGPQGLTGWQGYPARATSWDVLPHGPLGASGVPPLLLEETQAAIVLLSAQCCGLRDTGVPIGAFQTWLWCYPADQYLFAMKRNTEPDWHWPLEKNAARQSMQSLTTCIYERDSAPLPSKSWVTGFDQDLQQQLFKGLDSLFSVWSQTTRNGTMHAAIGLLNGHAALSWGWRESALAMNEPATLRVVGQVDFNHAFTLELVGDVTLGVTQTRMRLSIHGNVPIAWSVERTRAQDNLLESMVAKTVQWELGFQVTFDPIAVEDAAMVSAVSGCTGSLTGEFGLRPRTQGGGGWQWYLRMQTTAVAVDVLLHDPILGVAGKTVPLLPAIPMLDWSLG